MIIQAALTKPEMVEALGHNVPRIFMIVFGGGVALAALAGVIGGNAFITEPGMAAAVGSIVFVVVVVGGMGSIAGAFIASLLIGFIQTIFVALSINFADIAQFLGLNISPLSGFGKLTLTELAPVIPYLLMVGILIFRPRGLMGVRES
jgi:branched-chain amino acid transport system permease protein